MTSVHHKSGTDRCYEAFAKIGSGYDIIVNVQGDEPFIQRSQFETIKTCFEEPSTQIATLVKPFTSSMGMEALENINSPKVVELSITLADCMVIGDGANDAALFQATGNGVTFIDSPIVDDARWVVDDLSGVLSIIE